MNTASLDDSGSVSIEAEDYGYPNYISSSFSASVEFQDTRTPILITEVIDQKPAVSFGHFNWTFSDLTDVTGSWNYYSQSIQSDDLKTAIISSSNMSASHFGEVYIFRVEDSEHYFSSDTDYDVGDYRKYRNFEDGVLLESYLLPVTKSDGPYSIPPWS
jgi:hypothetical protein